MQLRQFNSFDFIAYLPAMARKSPALTKTARDSAMRGTGRLTHQSGNLPGNVTCFQHVLDSRNSLRFPRLKCTTNFNKR